MLFKRPGDRSRLGARPYARAYAPSSNPTDQRGSSQTNTISGRPLGSVNDAGKATQLSPVQSRSLGDTGGQGRLPPKAAPPTDPFPGSTDSTIPLAAPSKRSIESTTEEQLRHDGGDERPRQGEESTPLIFHHLGQRSKSASLSQENLAFSRHQEVSAKIEPSLTRTATSSRDFKSSPPVTIAHMSGKSVPSVMSSSEGSDRRPLKSPIGSSSHVLATKDDAMRTLHPPQSDQSMPLKASPDIVKGKTETQDHPNSAARPSSESRRLLYEDKVRKLRGAVAATKEACLLQYQLLDELSAISAHRRNALDENGDNLTKGWPISSPDSSVDQKVSQRAKSRSKKSTDSAKDSEPAATVDVTRVGSNGQILISHGKGKVSKAPELSSGNSAAKASASRCGSVGMTDIKSEYANFSAGKAQKVGSEKPVSPSQQREKLKHVLSGLRASLVEVSHSKADQRATTNKSAHDSERDPIVSGKAAALVRSPSSLSVQRRENAQMLPESGAVSVVSSLRAKGDKEKNHAEGEETENYKTILRESSKGDIIETHPKLDGANGDSPSFAVQCPDLWCKDELSYETVIPHIRKHHPFALWLGHVGEDYASRHTWYIKSHSNFNAMANTWVLTLLEFDGQTFVTTFCRDDRLWYTWMSLVGCPESAQRYVYEARLEDHEGRPTHLRHKGYVHSIETPKERQRADCLVMTDAEIKLCMTNRDMPDKRLRQGYDFRLPIEYKIRKV
jgi:hypothetical protein